MAFAGFAGIVTGLGRFAVRRLIVFLGTKGSSFTFDPGGNDGEFAKLCFRSTWRLQNWTWFGAGSMVFCWFGSSNFGSSNARSLKSFASPLFLVAMSIIYGVLFAIFLVLNCENHRNHPNSNCHTRFKYTPEPGIWVQRSRRLLPWLQLACRRDDQMRASSQPERVSPRRDPVLGLGIRACNVIGPSIDACCE
jgi:hypothetical protein